MYKGELFFYNSSLFQSPIERKREFEKQIHISYLISQVRMFRNMFDNFVKDWLVMKTRYKECKIRSLLAALLNLIHHVTPRRTTNDKIA